MGKLKAKREKFGWKPFSAEAMRSIFESTARINIWHGAVRSGKTIASIVRWLEWVRTAPPGDLLMIGKTERALYRNVLEVIGTMVGSSRYRYNRGTGEVFIFGRRIYVAGANDERSEGKIRGMTLAGAYCDEVTLWPENVWRMLMTRMSVAGAKVFATTNPDTPSHWLKRDYIDRAGEIDLKEFHFSLETNLALDPAYAEQLRKEFTGLWYKRFVLGLWVQAAGSIYDMLDEKIHVVDKLPRIKRWWAGCDAGTTNATVLLLAGLGEDNCLYFVHEYRHDSAKAGFQKTNVQFTQDFKAFLARHNVKPEYLFIDPAAADLKKMLTNNSVAYVRDANHEVLDGIREFSSLLAAGRVKFLKGGCADTWNELLGYSWNPKAQARGEDKPLKIADHGADAARYLIRGTRHIWGRWIKEVA